MPRSKTRRLKIRLWLAVEHKHDAAAELLVQHIFTAGIDIDAQDKEGQTVLMRAMQVDASQELTKLLIRTN
jgi:hypothetical protein